MTTPILDRGLVMDAVRVARGGGDLLLQGPCGARGRESRRPGRRRRHAHRPQLELAIEGVIVIGEGEQDEAPMLSTSRRAGGEGWSHAHRHRAGSPGRNHADRQVDGQRLGGDGLGAGGHACSMRRIPIWTRSPAALAIRRVLIDLDRSPAENVQGSSRGEESGAKRHHGLRARPPAPCRDHRLPRVPPGRA